MRSYKKYAARSACLCLLLGLPLAQAQESAELQAFTNLRLFDGTGAVPVDDAVLLVRDGRVAAAGSADTVTVPAEAERIDLGGAFVMPGMVNAHGHAAEDTEHKLELFAGYGVTTVLSLGGETEVHAALRDAQDPAAPGTARLFIAGPIQERYEDVEGAVAGIEQLDALNVDWVKARVMNGNMSERVYRTVIEQAHAHNLKVAAHMFTLEETKGLLRAGLDVLAHSIRDQPVDDELLRLMHANEACLIPTLTREVSTYVYADRPAFFDDPFFLRGAAPADVAALSEPSAQERYADNVEQGQYDLAMAQRNLVAIREAGLRVAMGTDSGAFVDRFPGYFEHLELQLMVEAGLSPQDTLVAATGMAADCMDLDEVGTLTTGKWADFLVIDGDPLTDIMDTTQLRDVWIAGQRLDLP